MFKHFHCFIILFSFLLSCAPAKNRVTQTTNSLAATELLPFGRFRLTDERNLELISSAVHFGFSFEGAECRIFASLSDANAHNYLQYEMDGSYQKRIKIQGGSNEPILLTASNGGRHTVWIYKATEAHTGPIFIQKIEGNSLQIIPNPALPLIEFIGNSITCGAAADPSEVPCGTGVYHDQHNAYYAYGPRVGRSLGTNYILSSVSGIGIYRNWNSDGPTMPQVYEKTDFQNSNPERWNFSNYNPQIVSIALGTNDFSNGDGIRARLPFDSATFTNNYLQFIKLVKSKYPNARIALLSSPMVGGNNRVHLQNILTTIKEKTDAAYPTNKPVALYFFKPMQARGCGGHPNIEDHGLLAEELLPFFKGLL